MIRRLETIVVEKPWGRTDLPCEFGDFGSRRIGEIWFAHPEGDAAPILVKFLFTSERLSIQVHPDDAAARGAGFARGKEECWLILDADPGAELGVGLKGESSRDALRVAAGDGSLVDMVDWRPAAAGHFIYNPAGTIHAIGAGLTLVEVQQNVDCTYRLYDYGRPRELHLDAGLDVAIAGPVRDVRDTIVDPATDRLLVNGPHFGLLHLSGPIDRAVATQIPAEAIVVPLSRGCFIGGESLGFGEAALTDDPALIDIAPGGRALLAWAV